MNHFVKISATLIFSTTLALVGCVAASDDVQLEAPEHAVFDTSDQPERLNTVLVSDLITAGVGITRSPSTQSTFVRFSTQYANVDTSRYQVLISSMPDGYGPVIVDDDIIVNGRTIPGFAGTLSDPMKYLGQNPTVACKAIDPVDISGDMRKDGILNIQFADSEGYTYCATRLYVVIRER